MREEIPDERGKHECYGHTFICSPLCIGYEIEKENDCENFEIKGNETVEEIESQWRDKAFYIKPDKSTKLFLNELAKRK